MKTIFSNQDFLNKLNPNVDIINGLKTQRNWAIGIAVISILAALFLGDRLRNNKPPIAKMQNPVPDNKKV